MRLFPLLAAAAITALQPITAEACTSLIAARGATADGSVMITYAADSHTLYGELYNQPAADHPAGAMREVVDWDSGRHLGFIPEVRHTYATIGNMNEHGLAIAESTWGGREELADSTGIVDYGSLIYIALQRAKTAREAIKVMTGLVAEHGYASEGESFSIADKDEAWIMELIGKGPGRKGAVWVARRVPDGCISGHANNPRIHQFPLDEPETTLYSPDVISFAREKGYFSGRDADFSFANAYSVPDMMSYRGCDARAWAFFNKFAPAAAAKYLPWAMRGEGEPMPLWFEPERKLTVQDMQWMMRDHFEGTPMDMTNDIGAGPFDVPYRWRPMEYVVDSVTYTHERAIATQQTGFTFVAQLRDGVPAPMRGILWFGVDDANTAVYVPVYCCVTTPPHCFAHGNGDLLTLSWDAAFWVNNYVANQAYNRYSQMIPDIRRVQSHLETTMADEAAALEAELADKPVHIQRQRLAAFSDRWAEACTKRYKELGDYLLVKFLDGNIKAENSPENFSRTPTGMPARPAFGGYNERYFRSIVDEQGDRLKVIEINKK